MARKIGSVTPLWNQEAWIKPHFNMLSKLDKNVVLMQTKPLPNYHREHGYALEADKSEEILRQKFPSVEIYPSEYPDNQEFGPEIYNQGLKYLEDCDIVFRLDPDMFFEDQVWEDLLSYIQNTTYDCYKMDFANDSMNYYMTGDFEHGLKDAQEFDPLAFSPKTPLIWGNPGFDCATTNQTVIKFPGFFCHHFRGWNKPKSIPNPEWRNSDYARTALQIYGDNGEWYSCPQSIREKIKGERE